MQAGSLEERARDLLCYCQLEGVVVKGVCPLNVGDHLINPLEMGFSYISVVFCNNIS